LGVDGQRTTVFPSDLLQGVYFAPTHVNKFSIWASALAGKVLGSKLKAHGFLTELLGLMLSRLDSQWIARSYATGSVVIDVA
jgi:hypothetical protein